MVSRLQLYVYESSCCLFPYFCTQEFNRNLQIVHIAIVYICIKVMRSGVRRPRSYRSNHQKTAYSQMDRLDKWVMAHIQVHEDARAATMTVDERLKEERRRERYAKPSIVGGHQETERLTVPCFSHRRSPSS